MKQLLFRYTYLSLILFVTQILAVEVTSAQFVRNNIEYNQIDFKLTEDSTELENPYYKVEKFDWMDVSLVTESHDDYYYPDTSVYHEPGIFSVFPDEIRTADFNLDGLQDFVMQWLVSPHTISRESNTPLSIFINQGDSTFTLFENYTNDQLLLNFSYRPRIGRFNDDAYPDVIAASMGVVERYEDGTSGLLPEPIPLLLSNGDGSYRDGFKSIEGQENGSYHPDFGFAHDASVGDINGDGFDDFYQGRMLFVNNGDGTFRNYTDSLPDQFHPHRLPDFGGYYAMSSDMGDLNNDGIDDITLFLSENIQKDNESPVGFIWLSSEGQPLWYSSNVIELYGSRYGPGNTKFNNVISYDVDKDGFKDIVSGVTRALPYYKGSHIEIYKNGDGISFDLQTSNFVQFPDEIDEIGGEGQFYEEDVNNDGITDLIHVLIDSGARIYLNNNGKLIPQKWQIIPYVYSHHVQGYNNPWEREKARNRLEWSKAFPVHMNDDSLTDFISSKQFNFVSQSLGLDVTYREDKNFRPFYSIIAKRPLRTQAPTGEIQILHPSSDTTLDANHILIKWSENESTDYNIIELSEDPDFISMIDSIVIEDTTSYQFTDLITNKDYYWRLKGANNMGYTSYTPVRSFTTGALTSSESENIPSSFSLRQNYPNPFNPVTQIEFEVPFASEIRLEVFDVLGRSVRVLADGLYGAGAHSVSFEASDLPSGLYMYRLTSADYVQTRSMQLVK
jgi:hypothetical protein